MKIAYRRMQQNNNIDNLGRPEITSSIVMLPVYAYQESKSFCP